MGVFKSDSFICVFLSGYAHPRLGPARDTMITLKMFVQPLAKKNQKTKIFVAGSVRLYSFRKTRLSLNPKFVKTKA